MAHSGNAFTRWFSSGNTALPSAPIPQLDVTILHDLQRGLVWQVLAGAFSGQPVFFTIPPCFGSAHATLYYALTHGLYYFGVEHINKNAALLDEYYRLPQERVQNGSHIYNNQIRLIYILTQGLSLFSQENLNRLNRSLPAYNREATRCVRGKQLPNGSDLACDSLIATICQFYYHVHYGPETKNPAKMSQKTGLWLHEIAMSTCLNETKREGKHGEEDLMPQLLGIMQTAAVRPALAVGASFMALPAAGAAPQAPTGALTARRIAPRPLNPVEQQQHKKISALLSEISTMIQYYEIEYERQREQNIISPDQYIEIDKQLAKFKHKVGEFMCKTPEELVLPILVEQICSQFSRMLDEQPASFWPNIQVSPANNIVFGRFKFDFSELLRKANF